MPGRILAAIDHRLLSIVSISPLSKNLTSKLFLIVGGLMSTSKGRNYHPRKIKIDLFNSMFHPKCIFKHCFMFLWELNIIRIYYNKILFMNKQKTKFRRLEPIVSPRVSNKGSEVSV